ncbi:MAG: hypothetical protein KDA25_02645 [Phycisphaerales bacterium]|nr:hypothetical protein [Phycisphaerales bacterium]
MPIDATKLLRRLEPAVRPGAAPARSGGPATPIERQSFDQLLTLVSHGSVSSGRQVRLEFEADPPFEAEQMERMGAAADVAAASGAARALLLVDGRGVVLDVAERVLAQELRAGGTSPLVALDAAVHVSGPDDPVASGPTPPPGLRRMPPEIIAQFGGGSSSGSEIS